MAPIQYAPSVRSRKRAGSRITNFRPHKHISFAPQHTMVYNFLSTLWCYRNVNEQKRNFYSRTYSAILLWKSIAFNFKRNHIFSRCLSTFYHEHRHDIFVQNIHCSFLKDSLKWLFPGERKS